MNLKLTKYLRPWRGFFYLGAIIGILSVSSCNNDDDGEPTDMTPPGEVSNFVAEAGDGFVILSWTAPSDADVSNFSLTYTPNGPASPIVLSSNTTTTSISDLVNGTEYTFTISVVDATGNASSGVTVTVTPLQPEGTLFTEDFEDGCEGGDGSAPTGWVVFSPNDNASWSCDGRLGSFAMQANNFDFTGSLPAAADWLISPVMELPENNSFELSFEYSSNGDEVEGFGLTARISTDYSGSGDPTVATWTDLEAGIQEVNTGVNELNLAGNASLSNFSGMAYIAFFYTSSGSAAGEVRRIFVDNVKVATANSEDTFAPGNVTGLTAVPEDGAVTLNWTAPTDSDLAGYNLDFTPNGSSMMLDASATSTTIEGLDNGTEYTFTIVSFDDSGNQSSGVDVTGTPVAPAMALFSEDFNATCTESGGSPEGWTIFSSASDRDWSCSERNGPFSMEVNGFGGDTGSEDWLISPAINLEAGSDFALTFDYSQRFNDLDGFGLEARISDDYSGSGDPAAATWTTLDAGIAPTDDDTSVPSSAVSLGNFSGDVHIAFFYTSSAGDSARRVTVDNVVISNFVYSETFDTACSAAGEAPMDWTIFSSASDRDWSCSDRNGEFSMEMNGFGGDTGSEDWLITPVITLDSGNTASLTFDYSQRFNDLDGFGLEARISTDYTGSGDPSSAIWTTLEAGIAPTDSDSPVASTPVSLSDFDGEVYLAFFYTSSAGDSARRVTLDNVRISN